MARLVCIYRCKYVIHLDNSIRLRKGSTYSKYVDNNVNICFTIIFKHGGYVRHKFGKSGKNGSAEIKPFLRR